MSYDITTLRALLGIFAGIAVAAVIARLVLSLRRRSSDVPRKVPPLAVPNDVAAQIRELEATETRTAAEDALVARGAEVVPHLLSALPGSEGVVRAAILIALGRIGDPRAADQLEEMVRRGAERDAEALGALVAMATERSVAVALEVLDVGATANPDLCTGWNRESVYQGVVAARAAGRITPAFRDALLPALCRHVGNLTDRTSVAVAVLAADPDAGAQLLLSDEVLGRGTYAVSQALGAFEGAERSVPAERAAALAASLPPFSEDQAEQGADVVGLILRALARSGAPQAAQVIADHAASPHEGFRRAAREARYVLVGGERIARALEDRATNEGIDALGDRERSLHLAHTYLSGSEIADWFAGPYASLTQETVAALRAIGAEPAAETLAAAQGVVLRHTDGPLEDMLTELTQRAWEQRGDAMDRWTEHVIACGAGSDAAA